MKILLFVAAIACFFAAGEALKCYDCKAYNDKCVDPFDADAVNAKNCSINLYCLKSVTEWSNGTIFVRRSCAGDTFSDRGLERSDTPTITSIATHFCDSDLCNGVSSTSVALSALLVLLVPLMFNNNQ